LSPNDSGRRKDETEHCASQARKLKSCDPLQSDILPAERGEMHFRQGNRRDLISLIGGTAVTWPLVVARAQRGPMP